MSDASLLLSFSFAITIQVARGKERHLAVVEGFVCVRKPQDGLSLSVFIDLTVMLYQLSHSVSEYWMGCILWCS